MPQVKKAPAEKVKYCELSKPGLVAVAFHDRPFTKEDIERLTKGLSRFALVIDNDFLYIYGE